MWSSWLVCFEYLVKMRPREFGMGIKQLAYLISRHIVLSRGEPGISIDSNQLDHQISQHSVSSRESEAQGVWDWYQAVGSPAFTTFCAGIGRHTSVYGRFPPRDLRFQLHPCICVLNHRPNVFRRGRNTLFHRLLGVEWVITRGRPSPRNLDDKYLFCLAISFLFRIYDEIKCLYKCYHCRVFMGPPPSGRKPPSFPSLHSFL